MNIREPGKVPKEYAYETVFLLFKTDHLSERFDRSQEIDVRILSPVSLAYKWPQKRTGNLR